MSLKRMMYVLPLFLPLYVIRFRVGPIPTTLLELYLVAIFAVFTYAYGGEGWIRAWQRLGKWRLPVVAWLIVTAFSVLIAPSVSAGLGLWRAYVLEPVLVFMLLVDTLDEAQDIVSVRRHFFGTVLILAAWATVQFVTGHGIPHPWDVAIMAGRRATGPFPFPNALALFVAPIAAWAFFAWLETRSDVLALMTWITGILAIVLARSEGATLAISVVFLLGLAMRRDTRRWAVIVVGLALFAWLVTPSLRNAVYREVTFQGWSGKVRVYMWHETWNMLKDHPILGAGFGGYPTVFAPYQTTKGIEIFQYPHTILFNFWSETGIAGVIVFAWIVYTWIVLVKKQAGWRGILAGIAPLLVILIHGLVDVPYFKNDLAVSFWMLAWAMTAHVRAEPHPGPSARERRGHPSPS